MGVWYVSREAVKAVLDVRETARANARVDQCIGSGARAVESLLRRRFYPLADTRYFDFPADPPLHSAPWRLWLEDSEAVSVSAITVGGVALDPADWLLRRADTLSEAPYDQVQINLAGSASFAAGDTWQRAIAVTGLFGGAPDTQAAAGALAEALDSSETAVDVTDSATIGVGHLLTVGTERMRVTGRRMLDTGDAITGDLAVSLASVTVPVASGATFTEGETILIDGERMLVVDIAGNNLITKRAYDGSVLAAHTTGADVYAARTLIVERGVLGTTAAAHDTAAAITRWRPPAVVEELNLAYALTELLQGQAGFARTIGSGESEREAGGRGLAALEKQAIREHRRMRMGAV